MFSFVWSWQTNRPLVKAEPNAPLAASIPSVRSQLSAAPAITWKERMKALPSARS